MWVIRQPKRPDFCGRVGCPLCYNWVDDEPIKPIALTYEDIVRIKPKEITGPKKMGLDLLGREPTLQEEAELFRAAQVIHARNLVSDKEKEQEIADQVGEYFAGVALENFFEDKKRSKDYTPRKVNTRTCDDLTPEEIETIDKKLEKQKKRKPTPEESDLAYKEYVAKMKEAQRMFDEKYRRY